MNKNIIVEAVYVGVVVVIIESKNGVARRHHR